MKKKSLIIIITLFSFLLIGGLVAAQLTAGNNNPSTILKEILALLKGLTEKDHLVCYPIEASESREGFGIEYENQLERNVVIIGPAKYFCVPTSKLAVNDEPVNDDECFDVSPDMWNSGACKSISWIEQEHIPQCCKARTPGGLNCGPNAEWVIGTTAESWCYVSNS